MSHMFVSLVLCDTIGSKPIYTFIQYMIKLVVGNSTLRISIIVNIPITLSENSPE